MTKKIIITSILSTFIFQCYGQLHFNFQHNVDLYKPYTPEAQEYMQLNDKVKSSTNQFQLTYTWLKKEKFSFSSGIGYKYIHHIVKDKILYIKHYTASGGQVTSTTYKYNPADLKSTSHSFSVVSDFQYPIVFKNRYKGKIGVNSDVFLLEWFNAEYVFENELVYGDDDSNYPIHRYSSSFFLSAVNLSFYYLNCWQLSEKFSLGARFSLGTNIYSDWDQFKRYVWLGVGLELGFGKSSKKTE